MTTETNQHATIYSLPGCGWCEKAKNLCNEKGVTYTEIVIGQGVSHQEFKQKYPGVTGAPFIILDTTIVGGYSALEQILASQ